MANFLKKKAKLLFFIYTIILSLVFVIGCSFMTNYKDIMVNVAIDETGNVLISSTTEGVVGTGKNENLYKKFAQGMFTANYCAGEIERLNANIVTLEANIVTAQTNKEASEAAIPQLEEQKVQVIASIPELEAACSAAEAVLDANVSQEAQEEVDELEAIKFEKQEIRNSISDAIDATEAEIMETQSAYNNASAADKPAIQTKLNELNAKLVELETSYEEAKEAYLNANKAFKEKNDVVKVYRDPYIEAKNALIIAQNTVENTIPSQIVTHQENIVIQEKNIANYKNKIDFKKNEIHRIQTELVKKYADGDFVDLGNNFDDYAMVVYEYRNELNAYNDLLFTFGLISLVALVFLYIFANHSRRIYYKSNLFAGVILPLVPLVFSVIMIVNVLDLMGTFNDNYDLFNFVSVLQNNVTSGNAYDWSMPTIMDAYSCSSLTFILTMVYFIVVIVYSLFVTIYSVYRYKSCAKERAEIIDRAVANND